MAPFSTAETHAQKNQEIWALETLDNVLATPAQRTDAREILGMSWEESLELEGSELEEALELEETEQ